MGIPTSDQKSLKKKGFCESHFVSITIFVNVIFAYYWSSNIMGPSGEPVSFVLPDTGQYVELPFGRTRYTLFGPEDAEELIVFVHGFSDYSNIVWKNLGPRFGNQGKKFRALTYDLPGRGYSTGPKGINYDEKLYVSQLSSLLYKLQLIQKPFTLVGLSMGGAIAGVYTSLFPETVKNLILIAPVGMPIKLPLMAQLTKLPLFGHILMQSFGRSFMHARVVSAFPQPEKWSKEIKTTQDGLDFQMENNPNFKSAIVATLQDFPMGGLQSSFQEVGKIKKLKTLILWGTEDKTALYENSKLFLEAIPSAELITFQNTGHAVVIQEEDRVFESMINFIQKQK